MKEMNAACGAGLTAGRSVHGQIGGAGYSLYSADCLQWMDLRPKTHVQAIVTDPPYGLSSPCQNPRFRQWLNLGELDRSFATGKALPKKIPMDS